MRLPGNVYVDNPAFPLLQTVISYWGITDLPGNIFGTTLACTDLANQPDYAGLAIKILDGGAAGQVRPISSDIAGEITVAAPWTNPTGVQVIAASTRFVILSTGAGGGGVPPAPPPPTVGLWMFGHCSPAMGAGTTTIICPNLAGLGDDVFNNEFWMQAIKTTVAATERQIRRITDYVSATGTFTVDPFANNLSPGDDVAIFHESILSVEILGFGTLTTSSATVPRDSNRAEGDDYFNGAMLMPTEGVDRFQPRRIVDYDGTGAPGTFTLDPNNPLTAAPGLVDYVIIGDQTEFVPATDATINRTPSDVTGSKADTADYTRAATQSSLVRLIKGILGSRVVAEGTFTLSSATVPEDNGNTAIADSYNGLLLMPLTGADAFLPRRILDWTAGTGAGGTGVFTIDPNNPFPAATGTVLYIVIADQTEFVPAIGGTNNRTPSDVIGIKTEAIPAMNLAPGNDSIVSQVKAILQRVGITPAAADDSLLTTVGQRDDAVTVAATATLVSLLRNLHAALSVVAAGAGGGFEIDGTPSLVNALGTTGAVVTDTATSVLGAIGADNNNNAFASTSVVANIDGSVLERLEAISSGIIVGTGTFTTDSATVPADTGQGAKATNYYKGCLLIPLTGVCAFQPRLIVSFTTATGVFTLDAEEPFTAAPGLVTYVIVAAEADLVPAANGTNVTTTAQVIGNKGDAATLDDMTALATATLVAELKRVLLRMAPNAFAATVNGNADTALDDMIAHLAAYFVAAGAAMSVVSQPGVAARTNLNAILTDLADILAGVAGITNFPAGAAAANTVSLAEVIRYIQETCVGLEGATALANKLTIARAGYLDELDAPNIPAGVDNILLDTQIRRVASGLKAINAAATKYLHIDSGTNGAEILAIIIKGVVGADWTIGVYVPTDDAVAAPAAGDKRDSFTYVLADTKGGLLGPLGIAYNMFLNFTNNSGGADNIDDLAVVYRSRAALTLTWEA